MVLRKPYEILRIELGSAVCQVSAYVPILSLQPFLLRELYGPIRRHISSWRVVDDVALNDLFVVFFLRVIKTRECYKI